MSSLCLLSIASLASLASFFTPALSSDAPQLPGYRMLWSDNFVGSTGQRPGSNWNVITGNLGINNELQTYTDSSGNVQLSGGQTVQLVPLHEGDRWTSGRIESRFTFTPAAG